eukprot:GHVU01034048.1.p1 GENE.GHVU01034048.1~~GHVU01034048.1.p1  ORF type:complete len:315 (-),score=47.06 GHVU01034048.1:138-1082(-)
MADLQSRTRDPALLSLEGHIESLKQRIGRNAVKWDGAAQLWTIKLNAGRSIAKEHICNIQIRLTKDFPQSPPDITLSADVLHSRVTNRRPHPPRAWRTAGTLGDYVRDIIEGFRREPLRSRQPLLALGHSGSKGPALPERPSALHFDVLFSPDEVAHYGRKHRRLDQRACGSLDVQYLASLFYETTRSNLLQIAELRQLETMVNETRDTCDTLWAVRVELTEAAASRREGSSVPAVFEGAAAAQLKQEEEEVVLLKNKFLRGEMSLEAFETRYREVGLAFHGDSIVQQWSLKRKAQPDASSRPHGGHKSIAKPG